MSNLLTASSLANELGCVGHTWALPRREIFFASCTVPLILAGACLARSDTASAASLSPQLSSGTEAVAVERLCFIFPVPSSIQVGSSTQRSCTSLAGLCQSVHGPNRAAGSCPLQGAGQSHSATVSLFRQTRSGFFCFWHYHRYFAASWGRKKHFVFAKAEKM